MPATIVGVSPTIRQRSFERDPDPVVYITHGQNALMAMQVNLIVRARDNPVAVTSLLRQEVSAMDPDVPVTNIRTMDEILGEESLAAAHVRDDVPGVRRHRDRARGGRAVQRDRLLGVRSARRKSASAWRSAPKGSRCAG